MAKKIKAIGIAAIVAATAKDPFYAMVPKAEAAKLEAEGLVVTNSAIVEGDNVATKATQKAIDANAPTADAPAAKVEFVIEDSVAIPAIAGRGRTGSTYPFDKLNVGQSFFVPKPAKNLASTVSSANARYSEEIPGETRTDRKGNVVPKTKQSRTFIVRSVEGGSRIWRKA